MDSDGGGKIVGFQQHLNSNSVTPLINWMVVAFDRLASRVLCATLAVPLPAARNQTDQLPDLDDSGVEKKKRLAALLSLNSLPTRQTLVKELVSTVNYVVGFFN